MFGGVATLQISPQLAATSILEMSSCLRLFACFSLLLIAAGVSGDKFNCPKLPPLTKPADNVYELRPQDIKVVMGLGDSITAAFGLEGRHDDPAEDLFEYRGQSWSMGGDPDAVTIAAFLRHYNPDIIGLSLGSHIVELCYDVLCPPYQYEASKDVLNAAQSGAMIANLVKHEFKYLYEQLTKNSAIDMKNDWKMLTLFIGANDLCLGCSGDVPTLTPDDFEKHLREILEEIQTKIPRVFVNVVEMFNLSFVYEKSLASPYCTTVHRVFFIECLCVFAPGEEGKKARIAIDNKVHDYNQRIRKVAAEYYKKYSDFAVVVQPGFRDGRADEVPLDFLSNLDCFHPSLSGHQAMAKTIWNNIVTPVAKKKTTFNMIDPYVCPTNTTLLYTD